MPERVGNCHQASQVNLLQRLPLRLGAHKNCPEEMRHEASAEEREDRRRHPCGRHRREDERERRTERPVREAAKALSA